MDGWTDGQQCGAGEQANREAARSFFGRLILHVNNRKTWTWRRALECVQSAQMTTIHPNIPVGARERATTDGEQTVQCLLNVYPMLLGITQPLPPILWDLRYSGRLKKPSLIGMFGALWRSTSVRRQKAL